MSRRVPDAVANERLLELATLIETGVEDKHFNFMSFGSAKRASDGQDLLANAGACGTVACALGWAPVLPCAQRMGVKLIVPQGCGLDGGVGHNVQGEFTIRGKEIEPEALAERLFGLTSEQCSFIFYPSSLHIAAAHEIGTKKRSSRQTVAHAIRMFCKIRYGV